MCDRRHARRRYETVRRVERVPDHQGVADEEHDRLVATEQHAQAAGEPRRRVGPALASPRRALAGRS
jgi:hypothetical protein